MCDTAFSNDTDHLNSSIAHEAPVVISYITHVVKCNA